MVYKKVFMEVNYEKVTDTKKYIIFGINTMREKVKLYETTFPTQASLYLTDITLMYENVNDEREYVSEIMSEGLEINEVLTKKNSEMKVLASLIDEKVLNSLPVKSNKGMDLRKLSDLFDLDYKSSDKKEKIVSNILERINE